jgi:putative glutamine amidotransferase
MILTTQDYMSYVYNSNAFPILVSPLDNDNYLLDIVKNTNMLLLSGGEDSDSKLYGQPHDKNLGTFIKERDSFEIKLISLFLKAKKPIFGICRGFQLLNIFFKGTLYQDYRILNENLAYHCEQPYQKLVHNIKLSPYLEKIYNSKKINVNSHHHQFINKLGENLEVIAIAEDGIIEAFKNDDKKILAVQWHPEMLFYKYPNHLKLLSKFIRKYNIK